MHPSSHPPSTSSKSSPQRRHHIRIKSLSSLLTLLLLLSLPLPTLANPIPINNNVTTPRAETTVQAMERAEGMQRANRRRDIGVSKVRIRERAETPQALDLGGMVKTVSSMRNGANQLLTETCYFAPESPSMQYCLTTVEDASANANGAGEGEEMPGGGMVAVVDDEGNGGGGTETFWPAGVSTINAAAASAPTSVFILPSALFPSGAATTQMSGTITASISEQNTSPTGLINASNPAKSSSSPTYPPPSSSSTSVSAAAASSALTGTVSKEAGVEAQAPLLELEEVEIPGQHLTVLPIGLSIYCAMVGLLLLLTLSMLLVRMRYRQKYRQRRHNPGMAIAGIAGMAGFGVGGAEMGQVGGMGRAV